MGTNYNCRPRPTKLKVAIFWNLIIFQGPTKLPPPFLYDAGLGNRTMDDAMGGTTSPKSGVAGGTTWGETTHFANAQTSR